MVFPRPRRDQRLRRISCEHWAAVSGRCAIILLVAVVLHVLAAYQLTRLQSRARAPIGYTSASLWSAHVRRARCAGAGAPPRLHRLPHPALHDRRRSVRGSLQPGHDVYANFVDELPHLVGDAVLYHRHDRARASTSITAFGARFGRSASRQPSARTAAPSGSRWCSPSSSGSASCDAGCGRVAE